MSTINRRYGNLQLIKKLIRKRPKKVKTDRKVACLIYL